MAAQVGGDVPQQQGLVEVLDRHALHDEVELVGLVMIGVVAILEPILDVLLKAVDDTLAPAAGHLHDLLFFSNRGYAPFPLANGNTEGSLQKEIQERGAKKPTETHKSSKD